MKPEHERIFSLLADWQLMGLCIEREARGEPAEGKIAVGTVILERVEHRGWDGDTIREVILNPWQFSWTMPEAGADYYNEAVRIAANWTEEYRTRKMLQDCCAIASGMLFKSIPRNRILAEAHCCQYLTGAARQAADLKAKGLWIRLQNGEDVREQYDRAEKKRWWKGLTLIKTIGHHEFYA